VACRGSMEGTMETLVTIMLVVLAVLCAVVVIGLQYLGSEIKECRKDLNQNIDASEAYLIKIINSNKF
jgi:hypothetical protein